jgi:uncharacterized protein (TIGR00106 family)
MILVEFSIYPLDKGESVGRYVARAVDIVDRSGLPYRLHAMGTVIEGEWDECMAVVARCFRALKKDCRRIEVVLKVDYRAGKRGRLVSKVASVEKRLGRRIHGSS